MKAASKLPRISRQRGLVALMAAMLLGAAGCAQLPGLDSSPDMKRVDQLGSEKSLAAAQVGTWPAEQWWRGYGDSQLDALIDEALRDSPNLAVAQTRLRQAQAVAQIAGASRMPEVRANLALTEQKQSYNYLSPRAVLPQGWKDYGQATIDFAWELDFWGKNRSALAAATSEQEAARAEVAQARLMLTTSMAAAYVELAHLYKVRDTAEAALALRTKTVELLRQRYAYGLEILGSVRQAEARQAAAQAELQMVDEQIGLARNGIAALVGAGPDRGLTIDRPSVSLTGPAGVPSELTLNLLGRRPDIVAARLRTEAAAKRIDQQKAGFYPSVNLIGYIGSLSLGINKLGDANSSFGSVGPAISLPIFNTNRLQGQLRIAHADYDAAVSIYNATLSNALRDVADAVLSRKALDGQLISLRASVTAAEEAHRIVSTRYKGELATYLDVLTAEDALLSARRSLADLESRALILDVALVRSLGGGYQIAAKTE